MRSAGSCSVLLKGEHSEGYSLMSTIVANRSGVCNCQFGRHRKSVLVPRVVPMALLAHLRAIGGALLPPTRKRKPPVFVAAATQPNRPTHSAVVASPLAAGSRFGVGICDMDRGNQLASTFGCLISPCVRKARMTAPVDGHCRT